MARALVYVRSLEAILTKIKVDRDSNPFDNDITEKEGPNKPESYSISNTKPPISPETNEITQCIDHRNKIQTKQVVKQDSFLCTICLAYFKTESSLRLHKVVWSSKHICNRCSARFCSVRGLESHIRRLCSVLKNKDHVMYCCDHCTVQSRFKKSIQSHLFHVHRDLICSDKIIGETPRVSKYVPNSENVVLKGQSNPSHSNVCEQLSKKQLSKSPPNSETFKSLTEPPANTPCTRTKRLNNLSDSFLKNSHKTSLKSLDSTSETVESLNSSPKTSLKILSVPSKISPMKLNALHASPLKMCNDDVVSKKKKQISMDNYVIVTKVEKSIVPRVADSSMRDVEKNPIPTNVDLTNGTCETPQKASQNTLVKKTHVNPQIMISLREQETQTDFANPIDSADSINCASSINNGNSTNSTNSVDSVNSTDSAYSTDSANFTDTRKVSYNLRPSRSNSCSTLLKFQSMMLKNVHERITEESCQSPRKNGSRKRKASEALPRRSKRKLVEKIQCKECVVRLERIDLKGKNVKLNGNGTLKVPSREHMTSPVLPDASLAKSFGTYKCYYCKKVFSSKEKRSIHLAEFHLIYMSTICFARYSSVDMLINHYLNQHIPFSRRECCVCSKKFDSLTALRQHMILHCLKVRTPKKEILSVNLKMNCTAFKKRHKCKGCLKRFWVSSCLEQHEKVCRVLNKQHLDSVKIAMSAPERSDNSETGELQTFDAKSNSSTLLVNGRQFPEAKSPDTSVRTMTRLSSHTGATKRKPFVKCYQIDATNRTTTYPCFVCGQNFRIFKNLCWHKDLYLRPANKMCDVCNTAFPSKELLQQHTFATHSSLGNAHYTCFCKFCNQGFYNMKNFWIHLHHIHAAYTTFAMDSSKDSPICSICNLVFESHNQLIAHKMYYYKEQAFECIACNEWFQGMYQLRRHNQLEHYPVNQRDSYIHKCNICKEGFSCESYLHAHKLHAHPDATVTRNHTYTIETDSFVTTSEDITLLPVKTYRCNVCDLYFVNKKDLRAHQIEYSNGGDFSCNKCARRYHTPALLTKHHSLNHTGSDQNVLKCNRCNEVLLTNTSMQCHEKHFHGKNSDLSIENMDSSKEFKNSLVEFNSVDGNVCTTCGAEFDDPISLKNHLLEYSDIGLYSCSRCQRKFTDLCFLEEHVMKHSTLDNTSTTHYCPICNEGFTNPANVRAHVLHLHRYETFGLKQNALPKSNSYKVVERTQDNIVSSASSDDKNDLKCPGCKVEFNINQVMRQRSRFKNSGHLKCPVCGYTFSRFSSRMCNYCMARFHSPAALYRHVIDRHPDDVDPSKEFPDSVIFYYLCKVCNIRYTTAKEFLAHDVQMHMNGRKRQWPSAVTTLLALQINMDVCCEKCGKMFQNNKCYKNHFKAFHANDEHEKHPSEKNVKKKDIVWQSYQPDSTGLPKVVNNAGTLKVRKLRKC